MDPLFEAGFNRLITGEEHAPNRLRTGVELEPNSSSSRSSASRNSKTKDSDPVEVPARCISHPRASPGVQKAMAFLRDFDCEASHPAAGKGRARPPTSFWMTASNGGSGAPDDPPFSAGHWAWCVLLPWSN